MRLFTRTIHLTGPPADVLAFSTDMRSFVSDTIGLEVGLWSVQFGAPLGTLIYSARVDGLAQLSSINEQLMGASGYHERLAKGADFVAAPAQDSLGTPLHGGDGDVPAVGSVVIATRAVVLGGRYTEAITWGTDMAIHSEKVTGFPVGFYMDAFGPFGGVSWLSAASDAAEAEAAGDKLNADTEYLEKLSDVGHLFVAASGHRSMATRIA